MIEPILWGLAALVLLALIYGLWIEPAWRLRVKHYDISHEAWGVRAPLRIVIISDLHAGAPHIPLSRVRRIVARANALSPDVAVLLGDYAAAHRFTYGKMEKRDIIAALAPFKGRYGTFAVLGNHDWWQDEDAACNGLPCAAQEALFDEGIPLLDNEAARIPHDGGDVWVVGLGDQRPLSEGPDGEGFDDIDAAMKQVTSDDPAILLAHEPDIFPDVPAQCCLTLSGHTHGGQIRIGNRHPLIMASENERFSYGRYDADGRVLVISGGIGCSELPLRINMPPEITVVTLRGV